MPGAKLRLNREFSDYWGYFEPIRQFMPKNCSADVEAVSVGHDLTFGTTDYAKVVRGAVDSAAVEAGEPGYAAMAERIAGSDGPSWGGVPSSGDGGEEPVTSDEGDASAAPVPA